MLGSQLQKSLEIQLPIERQEGVSSRGDELRTMTVCGDPVTGKDSESRCSADNGNLDAGMVSSGFTSPGAEATQGFGFRDPGFTGDMVVSSELAGSEPVVINRFYPLLDLGNGLEAEFGEGEAHVEEVVSSGVSQSDSRLHILPRESCGVVDSGCGSEEKDNCVLKCEPLSQWVPNDISVGLLA